jgi:hypothetical protein
MSKPSSCKCQCPQCQKTIEVTFWASVNVTIDPALKEDVLTDRLQQHSCPSCGLKFNLNTDLLYHDMRGKFMIYFQAPKAGPAPLIPDKLLQLALPGYQNRFVTSWNQLREKIGIFDAGLNDTLIELLKIPIGEHAFGTIDFGDDRIYFGGLSTESNKDGELLFEAYEDGNLLGVIRYPFDEYRSVIQDTEAEQGKPLVDSTWKIVNQASILPRSCLKT